MKPSALAPAKELAAKKPLHFPNESAEYRAARTALLAEEIELRRHLERVAEQRRALPPGGEVKGDYKFIGEDGATVDFAALFGDKATLAIYTAMYGPNRKQPCPMCTSVVGAWDGNSVDINQQLSFIVVAGAPIATLKAWKQQRGWDHIRMYTDVTGNYLLDYYGVSPNGDDIPAYNVFTRRDGAIRHFYAGEMGSAAADPGQDPRGAPDLGPMWTIFDTTPEGRDPKWYPKLSY